MENPQNTRVKQPNMYKVPADTQPETNNESTMNATKTPSSSANTKTTPKTSDNNEKKGAVEGMFAISVKEIDNSVAVKDTMGETELDGGQWWAMVVQVMPSPFCTWCRNSGWGVQTATWM